MQDSAASATHPGIRYVVELRVSPVPIDPHSVPLLDIFDAYRLYSEIGHEGGRVRHALHLGYFKENGTAAAIAKYLAAYFEAPRVVQTVPSRSVHLKFVPRKDIGATGSHSVIELAGERPMPVQIRSAPNGLPAQHRTAAPAAAPERTAASPFLLSRILEPLQRPRAPKRP